MHPTQTNQSGLPGLSSNLVPDIISNVPIHIPDAIQSPINEDEELDKIMQAVGDELKKDDKQPVKNRFQLPRKAKQKEVRFSAQPLAAVKSAKPDPVQPPSPIHVAPVFKPAEHRSLAKGQPKVQKSSSLPIFTVFVTVVMTIVLIAAAIAAYKK